MYLTLQMYAQPRPANTPVPQENNKYENIEDFYNATFTKDNKRN